MYKVLLFGGTVEGRTVAEYLNKNKIPSMVCVATEYGESLLPQGEYLELSHERLDEKQMEERMLQMENGPISRRIRTRTRRWNIWKKPVEIFWLPPGAKNCLPIRH